MSEKTCEKILCFLLHEPKATQYEMANADDINLTYAPVHQAVEWLRGVGLIEEVKPEKNEKQRGPLPKRYLKLTLPGFITALYFLSLQDSANRGVDPKVKENLKKAIQVHGESFSEIKVFSEWKFLEKTFGDDIYSLLETSAMSWFHTFGPLVRPNVKWLESPLKHELKEWYRKDVEQLQHAFVRMFLQAFLGYLEEEAPEDTLQGTPNAILHNFIQSFFEKERKRKLIQLEKVEKAKQRLLSQFAG